MDKKSSGSKRLIQNKVDKNTSLKPSGSVREVKYGNPKSPLVINGLNIECYVLDDETRVITGRGIQKALKIGTEGGQLFSNFINRSKIAPFISDELKEILGNPIRFDLSKVYGGYVSYGVGFEASLLPALCEAIVRYKNSGIELSEKEKIIAHQSEILGQGLSRIGLYSLIDEHTGFQKDRKEKALHEILSVYISEQFLPWVKTFPDVFYEELFRLYGWQYDKKSVKRPKLVGKITLELVYGAFPKVVIDKAKETTPKDSKGNYKRRLFQCLTEDVGKPHLDKVLSGVIALMKAAPNLAIFKRLYARSFGGQQELNLLLEDDYM